MLDQCGVEFIKGLAFLVVSLLFLANGFTASGIPPLKNIVTEDGLLRGCCILSIVYFITFTIVGMIEDHHGVFLIIIFILFFVSTMVSCGFLAQDPKDYKPISWIGPAYISGLIICAKLLHTSYFLIDKVLINDFDLNDPETKFLFNSLISEIVIGLFYSLLPYVIYYNLDPEDEAHKKVFTIWAYEFCDVISHSVVCLSYSRDVDEWNNILTAYYIIYVLNTVIFAIPMPLIPFVDGFAVGHMIFSDIVTDIPMLVVTIYSKSFVGNVYITVDIVVKVIVFARGFYVAIDHGCCKCLKNKDSQAADTGAALYVELTNN
eukprot:149568_1